MSLSNDDVAVLVNEHAAIAERKKKRDAESKRIADADKLALRARLNEVLTSSSDMRGDVLALYWDSNVPTTWISEAAGLSTPDLLALAREQPVTVGRPCLICGGRKLVLSRTERDSDYQGWTWSQHGVCEGCMPHCSVCGMHLRDNSWSPERIKAGESYSHTKCVEERDRATKREEVTKTRKEQYAEYLTSEHWRGVREWALERADRRCQMCNTGDTQLHVHHRSYERLGGELPTDLIVLCAPCHETFHENRRVA